MANGTNLENVCIINNRMLPTNGKITDTGTSNGIKAVASNLGLGIQVDHFYDNTMTKVGEILVPIIMTPEMKKRITSEFTNKGKEYYALNIESSVYNGAGYIMDYSEINFSNGAEITLKFSKGNPNGDNYAN